MTASQAASSQTAKTAMTGRVNERRVSAIERGDAHAVFIGELERQGLMISE
jgi:hypothetical protein